VALSADGNTLAVGGPDDNSLTGATWIFVRSGGVWFQQGLKLVGNDFIGQSTQGNATALSSDGNTLAVGGEGDNSNIGAVWIYVRDGNGVWSQQGPKLVGTLGADQGSAVSISSDGNTLAESGIKSDGDDSDPTNNQGAFWTFLRGNGGIWTQQVGPVQPVQPITSPITTNTDFGFSLSLSADGNTLAVGAPEDQNNTGAVWVFHQVNGNWSQFGYRLVPSPASTESLYGSAVDISSDGNIMAVAGAGVNNFIGSVAIFQ
jgi:hypothetical protein